MKKSVSVFIIFISILSINACNNKPEKTTTTATAIYKSKNTDSFNLAFDSVLNAYEKLRTAFINWDTAGANQAGSLLQRLVIYVPYEQLKDDEVATKATSIAQNASAAAENIVRLDSINDKRRMFYTLSESIYNLAKLADYDKGVLYHKKCPMAFNGDQEGWWFSQTKKIDNPYFGTKHPKYKNAMLECGTVEDSINNRQ